MKAWFALGVFVGVASFAAAAEPNLFPPPQKEHEWLRRFLGEWETSSEAASPDQPAVVCRGTLRCRSLGGFWISTELKVESMGMEVVGQQTVGYDPQAKKYVGTWVDSATSHLWTYAGTVDEAGRVLTLEAQGPNFMAGGKPAKFRDVYEFRSDDEIRTTSAMQGDDGKWITFMTGTAKRKTASDPERK